MAAVNALDANAPASRRAIHLDAVSLAFNNATIRRGIQAIADSMRPGCRHMMR